MLTKWEQKKHSSLSPSRSYPAPRRFVATEVLGNSWKACQRHTVKPPQLVRNCCKHIIDEFPALVN